MPPTPDTYCSPTAATPAAPIAFVQQQQQQQLRSKYEETAAALRALQQEHAALQARAARDRREVTIAIDPPSFTSDAGGGGGGGPELRRTSAGVAELPSHSADHNDDDEIKPLASSTAGPAAMTSVAAARAARRLTPRQTLLGLYVLVLHLLLIVNQHCIVAASNDSHARV